MTKELRLHLGCGDVLLPGWINVDVKAAPGVDQVLDIRSGLPFTDVDFIFAEHFIEHLTYDEAANFAAECRRVLRDTGVLRISTPNLDWVWATSYSSRWRPTSDTTATMDATDWAHDDRAARDCVQLNRAFRCWGHQFLYNRAMLTELLHRAGFGAVEAHEYGKSSHQALQSIEHHEKYEDSRVLPHVLVVEASQRIQPRATPSLDQAIAEYRRDLSA